MYELCKNICIHENIYKLFVYMKKVRTVEISTAISYIRVVCYVLPVYEKIYNIKK